MSVFLERVLIKNYKSIGSCDVSLGPLTFLVGPNGAGKSNFLEALRFVTDALRTSLDHAIRDRGGINDVRRRSSGHPTHFGVSLKFALPDLTRGEYYFKIGATPTSGFMVQEEEASLTSSTGTSRFVVRDGIVTHFQADGHAYLSPPASSDRLFLVNASGIPAFRGMYDALSRMGFYNLNPDRIRDLQSPDAGQTLARDGSNLASVLGQIKKGSPEAMERIEAYLAKVVPGIEDIDVKVVGPKETIEFRQIVAGAKSSWRFLAANMSDGTLRALGVLVALFQSSGVVKFPVPLIGIEEPEMALHPAASGVLRDSLIDASQDKQIIVTSHSPDLLDDPDIPVETLLAVLSDSGNTTIAQVDKASRTVLRDRLFTAGELLRQDQLKPDLELVRLASRRQLNLFSEVSSD